MNGIVCTPEELANPDETCLSRGQTLGLFINSMAGLISLISVLVFFALVANNVHRERKSHRNRRLVQRPMDVYLLSLFFAELVHSVGPVLQLKWVSVGRVYTGDYCSAQGLMLNIGTTAIAMSTLAIAVHTFATVWWGLPHAQALAVPLAIVVLIYAFTGLYAIIATVAHQEAGHIRFLPSAYWCWINQHLLVERLTSQWFWLWSALVVTLVLYMLLFFMARGNITKLRDDPWWRFHVHRRRSEYDRASNRIPYTMLVYALGYCLLVLPQSVVRWIQLHKDPQNDLAPSAYTFLAFSIYDLSGICNVILFFYTRSGLLLFEDPQAAGKDVEILMDVSGSVIEHENALEGHGHERGGRSGNAYAPESLLPPALGTGSGFGLEVRTAESSFGPRPRTGNESILPPHT